MRFLPATSERPHPMTLRRKIPRAVPLAARPLALLPPCTREGLATLDGLQKAVTGFAQAASRSRDWSFALREAREGYWKRPRKAEWLNFLMEACARDEVE